MSDPIHHECGIGLLRLKKPLSHFAQQYGSPLWGMNKLYLLMEKQHNRGQDGAGLAAVKIDQPPGEPYLTRMRNVQSSPLKKIYATLMADLNTLLEVDPDILQDEARLRHEYDFAGDIYMGHVRYGTHGVNSIATTHPFERKNNWKTKNILVSGNFNMTNVDEIIHMLVEEAGQHPKNRRDTITVLENIGYFIDEENDRLYHEYTNKGMSRREISEKIAESIDIAGALRNAAKHWDGGYVIQGIIGHGDTFVMRDPRGIRPGFYYHDDEIFAVASERAALATVFHKPSSEIHEIEPGHVMILRKNGRLEVERFAEPQAKLSCSFERIYFSRGSDIDIYNERKELGRRIVPQVLDAIDHDLEHTVFSYIPNTAETAFMGMMEGIQAYQNEERTERILSLHESGNLDRDSLKAILNGHPRIEKAAIKDVKLRTFITEDALRGDMVAHVYDTTHDILEKGVDYLVVIDDSIVRGTTLRNSILRILARLEPKQIVVVSSAPQIRYPDCYGIDMSNLNTLIAFTAAVEIRKQRGEQALLDEVYADCKAKLASPDKIQENTVNRVFDGLSDTEISRQIAHMLTPPDLECDVKIVYQTIENLHKSMPNHQGDWYFSGQFPTPGGNRVACRAFVNFMEGRNVRAY